METAEELRDHADSSGVFIALAHHMVRVREALEKAARADVRVVIYGEPGTGKEHAARYLHRMSGAPEAAFRCLSLRSSGVAERLAGLGLIESTPGGTLVLEAVDEAAGEVQAFLTAALEEWAFAQEGGHNDLRVVATAGQDLLTLAESGAFRKDLYYLLEVFPLALPPLRDRLEEIPEYLRHFHARYAPDRPVPPLPADFLQDAFGYSWPGNLRELENLVASSVASTGGGGWELPLKLPRRGSSPLPSTFHAAKREFEASYIRRLLFLTSGNITQAAELAGKARKDFYALLSRNGIEPGQFRR